MKRRVALADGLDQISIFDATAHINENGGPYRGMSREDARKEIVKHLEIDGLLEKIEPHTHAVGVCSRCDTVVEPMLSEQWFLSMRAMADRAIEAVRKGDTTFHPKRWENVFFNWLENIHDWCISRQLWWGHRIPAYRCVRCDHLFVAAERPSRCPECDGSDIVQDDDVLDTWFSSGLWPMSTLGWPDDTPDFARYYPTSLLLTGFDIIFFWVARMMMFGLEFTDKVPFKDVYITPLVRDELGKKMTKSKGNVVDPLDLMEQYGADAVRFTLAQLAAQGRDVILSHDRFAASRAFANKIWNAARFVMMNLEGAPQPLPKVEIAKLGLAERWILSRLDDTIREVSKSIDAYEFNIAAMKLYQFIWHEFCDWYIELSKEPLKAGGERQAATRWVLINVFDKMLRLLHPFMPFVSEEIWQVIRPYIDEQNLAPHLPIAKYPEPSATEALSDTEKTAMAHFVLTTQTVNSVRSLVDYHPGQRTSSVLRVVGVLQPFEKFFKEWKPYAMTLSKLDNLEWTVWSNSEPRPPGMVFAPVTGMGEVGITPPEGFDIEKTRATLRKRREEVKRHLDRQEQRMADPEFTAKASDEARDEVAHNAIRLNLEFNLLDQQLKAL